MTTPLVKERVEDAEIDDEFLDETESLHYRSNSMRLSYLAQDRTDLQRVTRELAKGMGEPTERHVEILKRAVRYLKEHPG